MAHVGKDALRKLVTTNAMRGLSHEEQEKDRNFSPCVEGNMPDTRKLSRSNPCNTPEAVIYTDVCSINIQSLGGSKYFINFVDDASGYQRAELIKKKSEAASCLLHLEKWIERQTNATVQRVRLNSGG